MGSILQGLNGDLTVMLADVRRSMVQVHSGHSGMGAGTVWHADGLIITNAHVARHPALRITLPDGTVLPARHLARNDDLDIAALSVAAAGLAPIRLGDSLSLQAGQWVFAMGHPWGMANAVSSGVVIGLEQDRRHGREWIAADVRVRPGHSGGPLLDAEGRLVGINTIMAGPDVGMAVPVHIIKAFLRETIGAWQPPVAATA